MLFTTPSQFAVLALVLVAGWFFGLASHPGGRKWRDRYTAEREAHATNRKQAEAHLADQRTRATGLERDSARVTELERENARIPELERENKRLSEAAAAPVHSGPVAQAAATPAASSYPVARTVRPSRGWFDWS